MELQELIIELENKRQEDSIIDYFLLYQFYPEGQLSTIVVLDAKNDLPLIKIHSDSIDEIYPENISMLYSRNENETIYFSSDLVELWNFIIKKSVEYFS